MSRRKLLINLHRMKDEELHFKILPSTTIALNAFHNDLNDVHADRLLRNRYLYIFLNGLLGIAFMIVELQVSWDGKAIVIDKSTKTFRILIFFSTLILLCQLMDYYRLLLSHTTHGWLTKRARGFRVTPLNVVRSTTLAPLFWAEVAICILQPIPFASGDLAIWNDPKWGLFMWLRVYMFGRVYRDFSHVYKIRQSIIRKYRDRMEIPPKFNWALSFKSLLFQQPLTTFIPFTLFIIFICSHIIYVFEREANPEGFTYPVSLFISFLSMFTGWPTDTYDEHNPATIFGRFGAILSCVLGLFCLSCLIENFSNLTHPTPHQRPILNYITLLETQEKERDSAARLIQTVWRRYRWQHSNSFADNHTVFNTQEAYFCMKYIEGAKNFGRCRRYRKQIESIVNDGKGKEEKEDKKQIETLLKNYEIEKQVRFSVEQRVSTMEEHQEFMIRQMNILLHNQQQLLQVLGQNNIPLPILQPPLPPPAVNMPTHHSVQVEPLFHPQQQQQQSTSSSVGTGSSSQQQGYSEQQDQQQQQQQQPFYQQPSSQHSYENRSEPFGHFSTSTSSNDNSL
ncbi:hypothetical protein DFA_03402 [Cavenderia fasciculata]|uniref:Potassium channel domain-containing protein n=1 Tax=Cavenderia fasciculata TaxID=261658 RepID=F4PHH0_CACFS|nr:uncharacterized protein DFA_03402 [Cavenderia fasciculata]EGG25154.1 hypothetical protein DFA_03402 [Cavenderia fasciculata]|eukprot:XP_004363005.1 hypothetical protein DFA_03402 [Cavenderia fasciculata]